MLKTPFKKSIILYNIIMSKEDKSGTKDNKKPLKKLIEIDSDEEVEIVKKKKNNDVDDTKKIQPAEHVEGKKVKKVVGRVVKSELYKKERDEILEKLNKITKFDGELAMFYIEDISEDDRKSIAGLMDDVRKFYKHQVWNCANNENDDKVWLLLLKNIYKGMGHKVSQFCEKKIENKMVYKKTRIIIEKI